MPRLAPEIQTQVEQAVRPRVEWALQHAQGGYAVFPLRPLGKEPLNHNGFKGATTDAGTIVRWWKRSPEANIGLATDGLAVVDVDPRNGGDATARGISSEHGPLSPVAVFTGAYRGTRGEHHYYRRVGDADLASRTNALGAGVDVKATGGYVVAPGSQHQSGVIYEGQLPRRDQLPVVPPWLERAVSKRGGSQPLPVERSVVDGRTRALDGLRAGERDSGLFDFACSLRGRNVARDEAEILLQHAHQRLEQPDGDRIEWPKVLDLLERVWREYPAGHSGLSDASDPAHHTRFQVYTTQQLKALPPPEFLIEGILVRDSLAFLYGEPGSAKSFVAMDWALSVATGERWFGRPVGSGPVLYIAAEGRAGLGQRVEGWEAGHGGVVAEGVFWLPESANLLQSSDVRSLIRLVAEHQPALIVIDTLARSIAGGDENSAKDAGLAVDAADQLRRASGDGRATVAIVHHTTKAGTAMRGSSALLGAADTAVLVRKKGADVRLTNSKQKDAEQFADIRVHLVRAGPSAVLAVADGAATANALPASRMQALEAVVASFSATPGSKAELRDVIMGERSCARATAYRAIKDLVSHGFLRQVESRFVVTETASQAVAGASHATKHGRRIADPPPGGSRRCDAAESAARRPIDEVDHSGPDDCWARRFVFGPTSAPERPGTAGSPNSTSG